MSNQEQPTTTTFESWALVELMGHQRIVGKASEETHFGAPLLRIDVPATFDPMNPGKAEIISDECGLDIGGQGGFSSVGAGDDVIRAWCVKHYEAQSRPVVVNGVSYPSPYTDGTLFQASESTRWGGYNVRSEAVKWSK